VIPKIGPSTVAGLTGIVVVLAAFCTTWAEGNPSTALAAIAAALTALVGALRSWQAVSATKEPLCDTESQPPA
jgi:nitrate/nitrite transporter NarK